MLDDLKLVRFSEIFDQVFNYCLNIFLLCGFRGYLQNINSQFSYSCYVLIDHHVIQIFFIFLLSQTSIASSGIHPIFTIDSMQKCEHKVKGKRFSV